MLKGPRPGNPALLSCHIRDLCATYARNRICDKRKLRQNIIAMYRMRNEIIVNIREENLVIQSSNAIKCTSDIRRNLHIPKQNNVGHGRGACRISNLQQCVPRIGIRMQIHCVLSVQNKTTTRTHLFIQVCEPIIE